MDTIKTIKEVFDIIANQGHIYIRLKDSKNEFIKWSTDSANQCFMDLIKYEYKAQLDEYTGPYGHMIWLDGEYRFSPSINGKFVRKEEYDKIHEEMVTLRMDAIECP